MTNALFHARFPCRTFVVALGLFAIETVPPVDAQSPAVQVEPTASNLPVTVPREPATIAEGADTGALAQPIAASAVGSPANTSPTAEPTEPLPPPAVMTERTVMDLGDLPDQVTFTFREAPWAEVLKEFADWSGLTLDMVQTPPGYFDYFDNRPHDPSEAVDILNGYLLPRGFVILRRDQFLVVLPTSSDMLANLIPMITVDDLAERGENELVQIVVTIDELSPEAAAEEIRGLLGPFGSATPLESSQSLVLQGFGRGLRQALDTLQRSRPVVTDDKLDFRAFTLAHLPVAEAEAQIRKLFGLASPATPANVSGAKYEINRAAYYLDRESRDSRDKSRESAAPPIPLLKKVAMNMQVSSLDRTNNLLVTATPEGLQLVEEILVAIDVPTSTDQVARWSVNNEPELRVYRVSTADEGEVAKTLDVLMPGVVVNEDRRQDTIHVLATPIQHEEVDRLIRKLDGGDGGDTVVEVISLQRLNPTTAASLLAAMFANVDRDDRPTIQAELPTRSLIVRGTANQIEQISEALVKFGEPADGQPTGTSGSSRFRRILVGGRSGETIAGAAQRILSGDKAFRGSIRVVVPGQSQPDEVSLPRADETTDLRRSLNDSSQVETRFVSKTMASTKPVIAPPRSTVSIEVRGDELLVYSGDPDSLDAVESTIRELVDQMPDRTRWTVFYLRVAEAEKAAIKLSELMADEIYPPESGLLMSEFVIEPMRIIADKRTNALFASGTESQIAAAEQFLELIDAADVPGSFLRREPHAIAVQYADVDEIAELLKNLYRVYLVDPVAERMKAERDRDSRDDRDSRSSSRSSSSSSRSSAPTEESPGIRLTLAVDSKTGELLVACSDQLFQEIEAVVRQRDIAARDSEPTIEFVRVPGDLPENFIEMLGGLSTKITVESIVSEDDPRSKSRTSSSKSSSSSKR